MRERWAEIERILDTILAAPGPEQAAALDRLCADDPSLRKEVDSLLTAHAQADGFLATSAESMATPFLLRVAESDISDHPGLMVGRYRLIEQVGRGGMGSVWLAERSDGAFEQRVALKLIRRGMDSEDILARFRRERQILARLEHPNIARLFDGGVADDGRPYLVMELVAGVPVTEYCRRTAPTTPERLRLFIEVCQAIGFAHRNLVVHRDIKPSNVLVDERGTLKLLDFGIAKVLGEEAGADGTGVTARLMTPEYASPEQVAGGTVTTASDVYQLGLLLHELITGERPSPVATSPTGNTRSRRRLGGDLQTIVRRALREEPELRYPSAEALAEDIERHLTHRPLRYGAGSRRNRTGKFIRRHRLSLGIAVGVIGIVSTLVGIDARRVRHERDVARHEADKAIEVAQLMSRFLRGWSPDASDRGEVSARKLLGDAVTRAERELRTRPEMLAATLSILGDFHTALGEWPGADSLLARAAAIQQGLGTGADGDRAATLGRQSRLNRERGRYPEAERAARESIRLQLARHGPAHPETLGAIRELAAVFSAWKKPALAETELRSVVERIDPGARTSPFGLEVASDLGNALLSQGRNDEAVAILTPTLHELRELFGELDASTLAATRSLASALRDRGDIVEAERLYRAALRITRALYGEQHTETQSSRFLLALVLERRNQLAEAESLMRQTLPQNERNYGPGHYVTWYVYGHLGAIRLDQGEVADAERRLRLARTRMIQAGAEMDPDAGDILNRLAFLLVNRGAPDADAIYREATGFQDARASDAPDFVTDGVHFLAAAGLRRGELTQAVSLYRRALKVYLTQLAPEHPYRIDATNGLAAALHREDSIPPP